jgi:type III secretory pathway component EscR
MKINIKNKSILLILISTSFVNNILTMNPLPLVSGAFNGVMRIMPYVVGFVAMHKVDKLVEKNLENINNDLTNKHQEKIKDLYNKHQEKSMEAIYEDKAHFRKCEVVLHEIKEKSIIAGYFILGVIVSVFTSGCAQIVSSYFRKNDCSNNCKKEETKEEDKNTNNNNKNQEKK